MQVIAPSRSRNTPATAVVLGTLVGVVLLGGGGVLAYLTLGTSFLRQFTPVGRASEAQLVAGAIAWSFALTAPALFGVVGLVRLMGVADLVLSSRSRRGTAASKATSLPDDFVVADRVRLPDGRTVPELVLGPFGAAVVAQLPPLGAIRTHGSVFEVRMSDGRWRAMEHPLDRTSRDAERVRRWLESDDRDHVVKTYAVVVAPEGAMERSASCAVVTPEQLPAWLAGLPPQKTLTESRRRQLVDLVRAAV
ncbi:MAG TPA: hypothetical protein VFS32_03895 [Candidatus Limnocylindrales bacterium]|nr:hypothetical protein [Candidatus Limnocylindrales bacterium]